MSNPILVIDSDYTVHYNGRKFGLATPLEMHLGGDWGQTMVAFSFKCVELWSLPPDPEPKPKRSWARVMGLKKPSKENE
ncbi:hypothetical protein ADZZY_40 [Mycobacterium phage Adzzy]|uniref:hypothetical protein n=1 Tax=Mycobacterium phage Adzzy TaxID=1383059 RepID=UPI000387E087|nr:hypothetical protein ADZZY_40 [Mycobacterium phage Adzzy]AGT14289.1 hypothetical protein ADZZY_40 [Mycobacterium phage Adzzy]